MENVICATCQKNYPDVYQETQAVDAQVIILRNKEQYFAIMDQSMTPAN